MERKILSPGKCFIKYLLWKITPQTWADKFVVVRGYKRVGNDYKNSYYIYQIKPLPNTALTRQASQTRNSNISSTRGTYKLTGIWDYWHKMNIALTLRKCRLSSLISTTLNSLETKKVLSTSELSELWVISYPYSMSCPHLTMSPGYVCLHCACCSTRRCSVASQRCLTHPCSTQ